MFSYESETAGRGRCGRLTTAVAVTASDRAPSATSEADRRRLAGGRAGRGRKARRGDIRTAALAAACRGAAQRLPDHAGGRGAQRRRVAAEPRLGLPRARAARGRGPDPLRGDRRAQGLRADRRGTEARRGTRPGAPAPWEQMSGDVTAEVVEIRRIMREVDVRLRSGHAHRQPGADLQGSRRARRDPPRASTASSATAMMPRTAARTLR